MYLLSWLAIPQSPSSRSLFKFWMFSSSFVIVTLVCLRLFSNDLTFFWADSWAFWEVNNSFFKLWASSSAATFATLSRSMTEFLLWISLTRASRSFSKCRKSVCNDRFSSLTFFNRSFRFLSCSFKFSLSFLNLLTSDSTIASLCVLLLRSVSKEFLWDFRSFISFSSRPELFSLSASFRSNFAFSDFTPSSVMLPAMTSLLTSASSFCIFLILSFSCSITFSFLVFTVFNTSFILSCWLTFARRSRFSAFALTFLLLESCKLSLSWMVCLRATASWLSSFSIFSFAMYNSSSALSLSFSAASKSFSFCMRSLLASKMSRSRYAFSFSSCWIRSSKLSFSSFATSTFAFSSSISFDRSLSSSILIFILRFLISFSSCEFFSFSSLSWLSLSSAKFIEVW